MSTKFANIFRTYVQRSFEAASIAFVADPSANNWYDLEVAMWAYQHVCQLKAEMLEAAALERLSKIAEFAKGNANFGE